MAGTLLAGAATVGCLTWAKWDPYVHKLAQLWHSRVWSGASILTSAGKPAADPSWHGAWSFTVAYGKSVWIAFVAALLVSASVDALLSRDHVVRLISRRGRLGGSLVGGMLALPCMMCTCCAAPIAATLRRRGVPTGAVLSYWLANPLLNPAVFVFLALLTPWQWAVTRAVGGAVLVFGVTIALSSIADRRSWPEPPQEPCVPLRLRKAPARFARSAVRLSITLVPEYFVIVFLLGAFRGWLFPLGSSVAHLSMLAVILAAVAGTLIVIPTAGEIPILQGLATLGLGALPLGILLVTLPAVSLPSMTMLARALTWRVVAVTGVAVAVTGIASGILLWALT